MGNGLGIRTLFTTTIGRSIQALANAQGAHWKAGGTTFDWSSVAAVGSSGTHYTGATQTADGVTFEDTVVVPVGDKAIRYGSVVVKQNDGTYKLATDGDTLVKGETYIVNETVLESDRMSDYIGVLEAGKVFAARLVVGGAGQPTLADLNAAMPGLRLVTD